jgi:IMP dehydrogenase
MKINSESVKTGITFGDFLLVPQTESGVDSRKMVDLTTKVSRNVSIKIPIISSPMIGVTNSDICNFLHSLGGIGILSRHIGPELKAELIRIKDYDIQYGISIGINDYEQIFEYLLDETIQPRLPNVMVMDVAHGGLSKVINTVRDIILPFCREHGIDLIAGNVATREMARPYLDMGIDGLRVGIGNGSICTTRLVTGCGYPQVNAIMEIKELIDSYNYSTEQRPSLISDGGIGYPGDIVKALAIGADSVMLGRQIAIAFESGRWEVQNISQEEFGQRPTGNPTKQYYKHYSGCSTLRHDRVPEGVTSTFQIRPGQTPPKLIEVISSLIGGIHSGFSYCAALTIEELRENYEAILISNSVNEESHPKQ